ncbi:unnamed protein product, partial [Staurois parvus]
CATFRSPHTACWCVSFCHRVLADYGPPIAAARPLICQWAPVPPPHAAARSTVCHAMSLYHLPLLLSSTPHSAMCTIRSPHTAAGPLFCHRFAGKDYSLLHRCRQVHYNLSMGPPYLVTLLLGHTV